MSEKEHATASYIEILAGAETAPFCDIQEAAQAAGLPPIAVSAAVGRALTMWVRASGGREALEIGTLGGYSACWMARGLCPGGKLTTMESNPSRAQFARSQIAKHSFVGDVEVLEGDARLLLTDYVAGLQGRLLDCAFVDAAKEDYLHYFHTLASVIKPKGWLIFDNALGTSSWWINDVGHAEREAVHALNSAVMNDERFDAALFPLREGLLVACKR